MLDRTGTTQCPEVWEQYRGYNLSSIFKVACLITKTTRMDWRIIAQTLSMNGLLGFRVWGFGAKVFRICGITVLGVLEGCLLSEGFTGVEGLYSVLRTLLGVS